MRLVYSRYRGQLTVNNLCTNMNFFGDFVRTSLLLTFNTVESKVTLNVANFQVRRYFNLSLKSTA